MFSLGNSDCVSPWGYGSGDVQQLFFSVIARLKFQNQESSEEILIRAINLASLSKTSLGKEEEKNGVEKKGVGRSDLQISYGLKAKKKKGS